MSFVFYRNIIFLELFLYLCLPNVAGASSSTNLLAEEGLRQKKAHIQAIATQSGDAQYFLDKHARDFEGFHCSFLQKLNETEYFKGALTYLDGQGVMHRGKDGAMVAFFSSKKYSNPEFYEYGKGLRLFPMNLLSLKHLTSIGLNHNDLLVLPKKISVLINLSFLDVSFNNLGSLPKSLCRLKNLKTLRVEGNALTKLPENIGDLQELRILNLASNRLSALPENFGQLRQLEFLNLNNNVFQEAPKCLGKLASIRSLSLRENGMWSVPLPCLQLNTLVTLDLSDNIILLAIADDVDEYEALKKKASTCLISLAGNIDCADQSVELLKLWHKNQKTRH